MTNPADTAEPLEQASRGRASSSEAEPEPVTGAAEPDAAATAEKPKEIILEMRQVAGLTAGSVMGLHRGSFQFRESDKDVGFSLNVQDVDDVVVIAGSATTIIDEIPVDEPTPLGAAVLNVGSACFSVRPTRAEPSNELRLASLIEARTPPKAIPVPEFVEGQPASDQIGSSRFGSLFSDSADESEPPLDAQSWQFLESIRDVRSEVAERHRRLHPDPEELMSRLDRLDPGLWDRTIDHPLFARFPIAYSTIPWEPRFDNPERIPLALHRPIREMSCLPWVPITANLLYGPLGIVGSRPAVLACARNAVLSLACLTSPADIEFSIVTAQGLVEDWDWTSSLPNSLFPSDDSNYSVAVADGMTHFDGAGLDPQAVKENEMGLIVLEESVGDLPDYCGTILQLTPEGQCKVTNHLGEQILGTPIGVAAGFAASAAALVRLALGDDSIDDDQFDDQIDQTFGGHLDHDQTNGGHADGGDRRTATLAGRDDGRQVPDRPAGPPPDAVAGESVEVETAAPTRAAKSNSPVPGQPAIRAAKASRATRRAKPIIDDLLDNDRDIADAAVADSEIADAAVADSEIADAAVADSEIADAAIADSAIADGDITNSRIADGDITDNDPADREYADSAIADGESADGESDQDGDDLTAHPAGVDDDAADDWVSGVPSPNGEDSEGEAEPDEASADTSQPAEVLEQEPSPDPPSPFAKRRRKRRRKR